VNKIRGRQRFNWFRGKSSKTLIRELGKEWQENGGRGPKGRGRMGGEILDEIKKFHKPGRGRGERGKHNLTEKKKKSKLGKSIVSHSVKGKREAWETNKFVEH